MYPSETFYTKYHKVRKWVICPECDKKKLKLVGKGGMNFISGYLYYYKCTCGHEEKRLLD